MAKHLQDDRQTKAAQQDELFSKIKDEMFKQFADSIRRVEQDLSSIKTNKSTNEDLIKLLQ